jgi:hypothetical protein
MSSNNNNHIVTIHTGEIGRQYYQVGNSNVYYDINFPLNIALFNSTFASVSKIGPEKCINCKNNASYNGIQITLCNSCITKSYEYESIKCNCGINLQKTIDRELNMNNKNGCMVLGCEYGSHCILNKLYKNVYLDSISLSHDHSEQLAYQEFMAKFPNMYNFNCTTIKNEIIDLIDDNDSSCYNNDSHNDEDLAYLKNEIEIARQHSDKEEAQYDKYYLLKWKYDLLCKQHNSVII